MPLYEYLCLDCGSVSEILVGKAHDTATCRTCASASLKKMLSAPAAFSGGTRDRVPGPGDTACCGSNPGHAGCSGPGSCCGKSH
jgi:putative FmdB family regulatory protein